MAASPEFYKPPAAAPCAASTLPPSVPDEDSYYSCRTPTASYLKVKEPTTCPPAPRKPPLCKKRLFQSQPQPIISLRLDELEGIFRPHPKPDKRRRNVQPAAAA